MRRKGNFAGRAGGTLGLNPKWLEWIPELDHAPEAAEPAAASGP